MHRIIAENRDAIRDICRRFGVQKLEAFGSAARGTDFAETTSDADFIVEFGSAVSSDPLGEYFGLRDALASLLSRNVDLVEANAVRNPYVKAQIDRRREAIYVA